MSNVIERVAKAIYGEFFDDEWPPEQEPSLGMGADAWRKAAGAAIRAMGVPLEITDLEILRDVK